MTKIIWKVLSKVANDYVRECSYLLRKNACACTFLYILTEQTIVIQYPKDEPLTSKILALQAI